MREKSSLLASLSHTFFLCLRDLRKCQLSKRCPSLYLPSALMSSRQAIRAVSWSDTIVSGAPHQRYECVYEDFIVRFLSRTSQSHCENYSVVEIVLACKKANLITLFFHHLSLVIIFNGDLFENIESEVKGNKFAVLLVQFLH